MSLPAVYFTTLGYDLAWNILRIGAAHAYNFVHLALNCNHTTLWNT